MLSEKGILLLLLLLCWLKMDKSFAYGTSGCRQTIIFTPKRGWCHFITPQTLPNLIKVVPSKSSFKFNVWSSIFVLIGPLFCLVGGLL